MSGLAQNKTIMIIIVVVVIALIALFVFKSNIFDFFKNLPNYDTGQGGEITVDDAELINMIGKIVDYKIYYLYNGRLVDTNLRTIGYEIYIGDLKDNVKVGRIIDNKIAFNPNLLISLDKSVEERIPSAFSGIFRSIVLKSLYGKKVNNDKDSYNKNALISKDGTSLIGLDLKATSIRKGDKVDVDSVLNWKALNIGSAAYEKYRDDLSNYILVERFYDLDEQGNFKGDFGAYKSEVVIYEISDINGNKIDSVLILTKDGN